MEDKQLVVYYNMRMQRAVEETKLKYGKMVRSIAGNILSDEDINACEDETYRTIWNNIPPDAPTLFGAYTFKTAKRVALKKLSEKDYKKKDTKHYVCMKELESRVSASGKEDTGAKLEVSDTLDNLKKELAEKIDVFLSELEKQDRAIFVRRYCFFDSYAEIANVIGISEQEVLSKLDELCSKLKKSLAPVSSPTQALTKSDLEKTLCDLSDTYIDEAINYRSADKKTALKDFAKRNSSFLIGTAFVLGVLIVYLITGSKYYMADSFNLITGFKEWLAVAWFYVVAVAVVIIAIVYMIRHKDVKDTFGKNKFRL